MKVAQAVLGLGLALFLIYEFFGDELINAAGFKSPIQHEVLADQEVTKDEALLLVVDFLERSGKGEAGAKFLVETKNEYICSASWFEDGTTASGNEDVTYSVDRVTGDVKLIQK
ncbi:MULTISPECIES: hypothetical protein [Bacillaceae]|uniref:PepSY domain-containing protein n=1 Tax=Metabacillus sediminis TaxID=3117746 RepID=A0ABZ2NEN7_9BACI|nr:hypothetical protein [Bacillus sp. SJS]KZZ83275.1 hypothetical protein AS29_016075 [Bacillus sp. SJS]